MIDDEKYKIALAEIDDILKFSDDEILLKIPESFKKFVKENKDKKYISNINPYLPLSYQNLKKTWERKKYLAKKELFDKNNMNQLWNFLRKLIKKD